MRGPLYRTSQPVDWAVVERTQVDPLGRHARGGERGADRLQSPESQPRLLFRLAADGWNALRPGRRPFHTLNPALARFDDGRVMAYGTMGGEGQPQTQAAVFSRYARFGVPLQEAVTAPRWLLGRTWGEESTSLKLESRFDPALVKALADAGHDVELMPPFTATMGHAGAIVRHSDGLLEGATDPRADGIVATW